MTPEGKGHNMRPAGDLQLRWYGRSLLGNKLSTCSVDESSGAYKMGSINPVGPWAGAHIDRNWKRPHLFQLSDVAL